MPKVKYTIKLSDEEKRELTTIVKSSKTKPRSQTPNYTPEVESPLLFKATTEISDLDNPT